MQKCHSIAELAGVLGASDNSKAFRVSLTKKKLSQLSMAKSHSLYESPTDQNALQTRPWRNSPKYFTQVLISTVALVKMSAHAKAGGSIEVMGMLTGKIAGDSFIVMDVYALPVEGTETRVNAQNEAYEYMVQYLDNLKEVKQKDSIVGWYHSHPGYGCWLSGIDVATQSLNQNFQDPYLAIVVDPSRTSTQGKVEIGAFRTFPVGYAEEESSKSKANGPGESSDKRASSQDMGAHASSYYSLDIKLFKSPRDDQIVDSILNKSWVSGLAQSQDCAKSYDANFAQKVEDAMNTQVSIQPLSFKGQSARYEILFEGIASLRAGESPQADPRESYLNNLRRVMSGRHSNNIVESDCETPNDQGDLEMGENESVSQIGDTYEEIESQIEIDDIEDEDDIQSVRTRDADDPIESAFDSDDASSEVPSLVHADEMGEFEEYELGGSAREDSRKKGTKRNLRTSFEDLKASVPYGGGPREHRKRFAKDDFASAINNELKHKMQTLQLELQQHANDTKNIGQAELLKLVGKKAQQRVFGNIS